MPAKRERSESSAPEQGVEHVSPDDLLLDAKNPRLIEYGLTQEASQEEILKYLWERMAVNEVAMSIAANGYWPHESLFVAKEQGNDVVIEGNRRLAAVRILLSDKLRKDLKATDLPEISAPRRKELQLLPIVRFGKRQDLWQYLGFKHVNGPARWGSFAKAKYIAFVHRTTDTSLAQIAEQIGDKHRTVQRLYRALMVIEQAEKAGEWKREFATKGQIAFSHLTTALEYSGFQSFLGLSDRIEESKEPVSRRCLKELGEVCKWLWGDNRDNTPPLIRSQNPDLRQLDQILANPDAVRALRLEARLDAAFDVSKGDDVVFEEALQEAKSGLTKAQGRVSSGFRGDERHLLDMAFTVCEMAADLYDLMNKRSQPNREARRPEKLDDPA